MVAPDEVAFDAGVFLLRKSIAEGFRAGRPVTPAPTPEPEPGPVTTPTPNPELVPEPEPTASTRTLRLVGHRSPRSVEPPWHENTSEAPLGFGAKDWTGVLGHSLGRLGGRPCDRASTNPAGTRARRSGEGGIGGVRHAGGEVIFGIPGVISAGSGSLGAMAASCQPRSNGNAERYGASRVPTRKIF